jgi:hypothetical protein
MAAYGPAALERMKEILDDAWVCVPQERRTIHVYQDIAHRLVGATESGECDPNKLKEIALGPFASNQSLDFLAGLAKQVSAEIIGGDHLQPQGRKHTR